MPNIVWDRLGHILEVAGKRSLGSVLRRIERELPDWVVVVRTRPERPDIYFYAFRPRELQWLASEYPERRFWSIERASEMHEWTSSGTARHGRIMGHTLGTEGPAAGRIVDFDAAGRLLGVGEKEDLLFHEGAVERGTGDKEDKRVEDERFRRAEDQRRVEYEHLENERIRQAEEVSLDELGLGPMRGGNTRPTGTTPPLVTTPSTVPPPGRGEPDAGLDITLSAETRTEIEIEATELVDFRIELTAEAVPLAVSQAARARADVPVTVALSIENDVIEVLKDREHTLQPPAPGQPRTGFFVVKAVRAGQARLAVAFRQGGSELGVIGLAVEVTDAEARSTTAAGTVMAAPRDLADDDKLALLVEQRNEGGQVFYEYILHSEALGLQYRRLRSKPLLDRGGGMAASTQAYVEGIYDRVTRELKSWDDIKQLQREARALGASLCRELFDPNVVKVLWPLRDRIKMIQVVSWEPYIPWELVRLHDPDSGEIDERFLAEYGLVRTLSDIMQPRELAMTDWRYLGASFPMGSFPPVGGELDYFTQTSPSSLHAHGIVASEVEASTDAFYDVLADGNCDVLHIACHAESLHQTIDRASLIIGDETTPGSNQPKLIEIDTITVEAEARFKERRPLVFLNACETGRMGAVLTAWGGWPNTFLRAGAGVFVGSSWAVRDKPAAVFATAFYNAMLDGRTLTEAASKARAAAKELGDASWLAFKVYGHPRARRKATSSNRTIP